MISIDDIQDAFETFAPKSLAMPWDNTGILINCNNKGSNLLLSIDFTDDVVDEAIKLNIDFLLVYHPIIFKPISSLTDIRFIKLIQNNISVYCPHTQLDNMMNNYIFNIFNKYSFSDAIAKIKISFELEQFNYFSCNEAAKDSIMGENLHVGVGSAYKDCSLQDSFIITGEISHHEMLNMKRNRNSVIILGHWNSEHIFLPELKKILLEYFSSNQNINITISKSDRSPYLSIK